MQDVITQLTEQQSKSTAAHVANHLKYDEAHAELLKSLTQRRAELTPLGEEEVKGDEASEASGRKCSAGVTDAALVTDDAEMQALEFEPTLTLTPADIPPVLIQIQASAFNELKRVYAYAMF